MAAADIVKLHATCQSAEQDLTLLNHPSRSIRDELFDLLSMRNTCKQSKKWSKTYDISQQVDAANLDLRVGLPVGMTVYKPTLSLTPF